MVVFNTALLKKTIGEARRSLSKYEALFCEYYWMLGDERAVRRHLNRIGAEHIGLSVENVDLCDDPRMHPVMLEWVETRVAKTGKPVGHAAQTTQEEIQESLVFMALNGSSETVRLSATRELGKKENAGLISKSAGSQNAQSYADLVEGGVGPEEATGTGG